MNRNFLIGFAVTVAVLAFLVFVASRFLEIYPRTKTVLPSRQAEANEYLALDRWLKSMGHPVRVVNSGDIALVAKARERRIFIQSSRFQWTDDAVEYLIRWVEEGGYLFFVLDIRKEGCLPLLEEFGIENPGWDSLPNRRYDSDAPSFDRLGFLEVAPDDGVLEIKDWTGATRLVEIRRGMGRLVVSVWPSFLLSSRLGDAPNARLAWGLFVADADPLKSGPLKSGWLFIRETGENPRAPGIVGSLFRHGNLAVLAVSILVLLVVSFWAVIPRFGLVKGDDERPGKSLRERFLAEGRFLKRYDALGFYRDVYVGEIKRRLAHKEGIFMYDEIISYIQGKELDERDKQLFVRAFRGKSFTYSEFPKMITVLMNILERI